MLTGTTTFEEMTGLEPGDITITGPNGLNSKLGRQIVKGAFFLSLPAGSIPDSGGSYSFQVAGGADVGAFQATVHFGPLLKWTNPEVAASVDRSQDLTVKWTGGNPGTYVLISGASATRINNKNLTINFQCVAPVDDMQFTVPSYILSALPAGNGSVQVMNSFFTPLQVSGLDYASAGGSSSYTVSGPFH
jgi:hypothetical protein